MSASMVVFPPLLMLVALLLSHVAPSHAHAGNFVTGGTGCSKDYYANTDFGIMGKTTVTSEPTDIKLCSDNACSTTVTSWDPNQVYHIKIPSWSTADDHNPANEPAGYFGIEISTGSFSGSYSNQCTGGTVAKQKYRDPSPPTDGPTYADPPAGQTDDQYIQWTSPSTGSGALNVFAYRSRGGHASGNSNIWRQSFPETPQNCLAASYVSPSGNNWASTSCNVLITHGATCTEECNTGYKLCGSGSSGSRTCNDGTLSEPTGSCILVDASCCLPSACTAECELGADRTWVGSNCAGTRPNCIADEGSCVAVDCTYKCDTNCNRVKDRQENRVGSCPTDTGVCYFGKDDCASTAASSSSDLDDNVGAAGIFASFFGVWVGFAVILAVAMSSNPYSVNSAKPKIANTEF